MSKKKAGIRLGAILGGVLVLVAFSIIKNNMDSAHVDSNGNVTKAGNLSVFSLKAGQCFNDPGTGSDISQIAAIPCTQPHDSQVIGTFALLESSFDAAAVTTDARNECRGVYDGLVDTAKLGAAASFFHFAPDEGAWNAGNRTGVCAVNGGTTLTQSVLK